MFARQTDKIERLIRIARRRERDQRAFLRNGSILLESLVSSCGVHYSKLAEKREREKAFIQNGGRALEKLVASCNGRPIPYGHRTSSTT